MLGLVALSAPLHDLSYPQGVGVEQSSPFSPEPEPPVPLPPPLPPSSSIFPLNDDALPQHAAQGAGAISLSLSAVRERGP